MWPLQDVVTSALVQGRTLMTWYARQNKTYRYGDENQFKVDNKGIRPGRRHYSRPLNNKFGQDLLQNETRIYLRTRTCSKHKQSTSTRYGNCQVLPTKTPEQCQENILVILLPTSNVLHTQLQCSILTLWKNKSWKCWHCVKRQRYTQKW